MASPAPLEWVSIEATERSPYRLEATSKLGMSFSIRLESRDPNVERWVLHVRRPGQRMFINTGDIFPALKPAVTFVEDFMEGKAKFGDHYTPEPDTRTKADWERQLVQE